MIILLSVLPLAAVQNKGKLESVSVQLHWVYEYSFVGFFIAKEKGFYKDVGLDVTLKEYRHGMDIVDEVLSGRATYGIYNSRLLLEYLQGKPITLLASFYKRSALVLVAQPQIKELSDLKGKNVMGSTKKDFLINFGPYFAKYGLHVDDFTIVPHTFGIEAFVKKKVDAMTAFTANELLKLDRKGVVYTRFDPSEENLFVTQLDLFTSKEEIKNHPKRTRDFVAATIKGYEYAFAHPEEAIELVYKKYNRGFTKEELREKAKAYEKLVLPYTYEIGSIDRSFLKKQAEMFSKNFLIEKNRPLQGYIFEYKKEEPLELTYKEIKYIKEHPNIRVCVQSGIFPIDGFEKGKEIGIMGDVFSLIAKKTSLRFENVSTANSQELEDFVASKKCDIVSITMKERAKELGLYASKVIHRTYFTILTTLDKPFIRDPLELRGKRLLMSNANLAKYFRRLYPYMTIDVIDDKKRLTQELLDKKAYAAITLDEQADYCIDRFGFGKMKVSGFIAKSHPVEGVIAIQKEQPILASIIQKALYSIPESRIEDIIRSWHMTRYHTKTDYTLLYEVLGIAVILYGVMFYYQRKIKRLNDVLEHKVDEKTKELRLLNEQLEALVKEKVEEIVHKDRILAIQSRQAIMGEMITMIAHQWRQPLNTLTLQISNLQLRRMMGEEISIEEYDKALENISKTITYLSETIDDFQTFFHPDRKLDATMLRPVIEKALTFIKPRLNEKKIEVEIEVENDQTLNVYINELIQVLLNLLNNAIDALIECGKKEKKITIHATIDETITIEVRDNACGIKEEIKERLFEPYCSTKGKNGTGLGLYMSQMIMQKQFGGDIEVESSSNGSSFRVVFPKV